MFLSLKFSFMLYWHYCFEEEPDDSFGLVPNSHVNSCQFCTELHHLKESDSYKWEKTLSSTLLFNQITKFFNVMIKVLIIIPDTHHRAKNQEDNKNY